MTEPTRRTCFACGTPQRLTDVLAVIDTRTGNRSYVCRPGIGNPRCFNRVPTAAKARIERVGVPPRDAA